MQRSDTEIHRELCHNNGFNYDSLVSGGDTSEVLCLELFFFGAPRIPSLTAFQSLHTLRLVDQTIPELTGLEECYLLRELWVAECHLKVIKNICHLTVLEKLYLYANQIEKIEGLDGLQALQVLWLADNQISAIEGLSGLDNLCDLNLAGNNITTIGSSLNHLPHLQILDLSGNPIRSLQDIACLQSRKNLESLSLREMRYRQSAPSQLSNYATFILYHVPQLSELDGCDVTASQLRETVQNVVTQKRSFYTIQLRSHHRMARYVARQTHLRAEQARTPAVRRLRMIAAYKNEISSKLNKLKHIALTSEAEKEGAKKDNEQSQAVQEREDLNEKHRALADLYNTVEQDLESLHLSVVNPRACLASISAEQQRRWNLELMSAGNVCFDEGKPDDPWYKMCVELVRSRTCSTHLPVERKAGFRVKNVVRVRNTFLERKFDETLEGLLEDDADAERWLKMRDQALLEKAHYLFYMHSTDSSELPEIAEIAANGFASPDLCKRIGLPPAVKLTNSVAYRSLIGKSCSSQMASVNQDHCQHRQLLVAKVFIKQPSEIEAVSDLLTPGCHHPCDAAVLSKPFTAHPDFINPSPTDSDSAVCSCQDRTKVWYVFNRFQALPEYIVDLEFIDKESQPEVLNDGYIQRIEEKIKSVVGDIELHTQQNSLASLQLIESLNATGELEDNPALAFPNCGFTRFQFLNELKKIKQLDLSCNELSTMEGFSGFSNLEELNMNFNKLAKLDGLLEMHTLRKFFAVGNRLSNWRDDILILRRQTPSLVELDLRHNLWKKKPNLLTVWATALLGSLLVFNGREVVKDEAMYLRGAPSSQIMCSLLAKHSDTSPSPPRSLRLENTASLLDSLSQCKPDLSQDNWCANVTSLCLDGQRLSRLPPMQDFVSLKWASFAHNCIVRVEGLSVCRKLEELSVEDNCLSRLDAEVASLASLRELNISANFLRSLDRAGLDRLKLLRSLIADTNMLTSLDFLQGCCSLVELYVGNNHLSSIRDTFILKKLKALSVLDLFGNPFCWSYESYRLAVIYRLPELRYLDGVELETSELLAAKEQFSGRLTSDFIVEQIGHARFHQLVTLDLQDCNLRVVHLGDTADMWPTIDSLNLQDNFLTSMEGLSVFSGLKTLCLDHNLVERLLPIPPNRTTKTAVIAVDDNGPLFKHLQVLHVGSNHITSLSHLQLHRLPALHSLYAQGNSISVVDGLEDVRLHEIVLDGNRIKEIGPRSFANQTQLRVLHLEENRLISLENLNTITSLQNLYVAHNRIQDIQEVEKLKPLTQLRQFSILNNPVARRLLHRALLVLRHPKIVVIDGEVVTEDEREEIHTFYNEHAQRQVACLQSLNVPVDYAVNLSLAQAALGAGPTVRPPARVGSYSSAADWQWAATQYSYGSSVTNPPAMRVPPQFTPFHQPHHSHSSAQPRFSHYQRYGAQRDRH